MEDLRVNMDRFKVDFEALAQIGATGDGGVHRPAFSQAHLAARAWLKQSILAAELAFHQDAAGNISGLQAASPDTTRTLLIGSHLDSVPHGGRFDGALGVVTALEVLRTVREAEIPLPFNLEAIDFTDEEGTLVGLMGSRALAGTLSQEELDNPRGGKDALAEGLRRAGLADPLAASRRPADLAGFLEVHIEQGPRLIDAGADIGIVEALVGIGSYELVFKGRADHAGTTAMDGRRDAGLGAAALVVAASRKVRADYADCVVNFGNAAFFPGAYNIVPASAQLGMEFRAPNQSRLDMLEQELLALARQTAADNILSLELTRQACVAPAPCALQIQEAFVAACDRLGLKHINLVSGAGHDTQAMAAVCPAGMIFIPSTGGSHNPGEYASWEAVENGANTMLQAALSLIAAY
jgi:N-carbamoyl-L-amino-acid hydrolase